MSDVNKQLLEALKELRDAYQEYMGLPACKANAAIAAAEQATSSVAGLQDFNDGFKAGAEEMRDGLLQLCKYFSDRKNRPYMGDVLEQVESLFDLIMFKIPISLGQKAEQAQQITDNTRVAWTSLGTVKAMLPELLASDDVKVRENAQIIDALVRLLGNQKAQQAEPRCACGDSFTSDAMCANCLAAQQQAVAVPSRMSYKNATQEFADGYNACIDDMIAAQKGGK